MNTPETILKIAFAACAIVGLVVFAANRRRSANQAFFLLALTISAWLGSILEVFHSGSASDAAYWIRMASVTGGFSPVAISILRASIVQPGSSLVQMARRMPIWFLAYGLIAVYCFTPLYLLRAEIPAHGIPNARYGSLGVVYPIYMLGSFASMLVMLLRDHRRSRGVTRAELEYVLAGVCCFVGAGIFTCVVPLITHNSQVVSLAPLWFVTMNAVIAYGIATRSILSVSALLRRALSYLLLLLYLGAIYAGAWWAANFILGRFSLDAAVAAPLVGTFFVALSVGRAQSFLQVFVRKLFINLHRLDLRGTLRSADRLLTQVTTTEDLLHAFVPLLGRAAGTDLVTVCLFDQNETKHVWSTSETAAAQIEMGPLKIFGDFSVPFALAAVSRTHGNASEREAAARLRAISGAVAVAIRNGPTPIGVVVLGEKLSGQVYDSDEQESVQLLTSRLGIALENARLYTEQRRSKEYLQSLLGELTSGVLACDRHGRITVCNGEAERILNQSSSAVVGESIEYLPSPFSIAFKDALAAGIGVRDQNGTPRIGATTVPVRYSSQVFTDPSQGAFLVFNDLTRVRQLEEQLRRSDRLAMLGTLSAGLAHEIRNPLAPIKAFVDLIPERAADPAFLRRFMEIVSAQVVRIERLISQLLSFSRAGVPRREDVACHRVLDDILALLAHDFTKRGIETATDFRALSDHIFADRQQLEQVILNALMNAAEAMPQGGKITVATGDAEEFFELKIQDNGPGVASDVLPHIFDPFVTTKESGTGLGLSIAYGIIIEHGGTIDITNAEEGATMLIRLPIRESKKLAA